MNYIRFVLDGQYITFEMNKPNIYKYTNRLFRSRMSSNSTVLSFILNYLYIVLLLLFLCRQYRRIWWVMISGKQYVSEKKRRDDTCVWTSVLLV